MSFDDIRKVRVIHANAFTWNCDGMDSTAHEVEELELKRNEKMHTREAICSQCGLKIVSMIVGMGWGRPSP